MLTPLATCKKTWWKTALGSSQTEKCKVINVKKPQTFSYKWINTTRGGERCKTVDSWKRQYIQHLGTATYIYRSTQVDTVEADEHRKYSRILTNFWNNILAVVMQVWTCYCTLHLTWQFSISMWKFGTLSKLKLKSYWNVLLTYSSLIKKSFEESLVQLEHLCEMLSRLLLFAIIANKHLHSFYCSYAFCKHLSCILGVQSLFKYISINSLYFAGHLFKNPQQEPRV